MAEMDAKQKELESDLGQLQIMFDEMIQMGLWGNATDLSLLPTMDYADIQKLQSVGKAAQAESASFILRNDLDKVWEYVKGLKDARVDVVLDNAGFELFTDLVLADFLVTHTPFVSKVVFHPKLIPWFVSDVLPTDFLFQLSPEPKHPLQVDTPPFSSLSSEQAPESKSESQSWKAFFSSSYPNPSAEELKAMDKMLARWRGYLASGVFALSVPVESGLGVPGAAAVSNSNPNSNPNSNLDSNENVIASGTGGTQSNDKKLKEAAFWTASQSYWKLPEKEGLLGDLKESGLVIFKGDLNYRKLTADAKWPPNTPFHEALGPLSGKIALLSLRTCKADVVVGLEEGVAQKLDADAAAKGWRVNGKYGLICYEAQV